MNEDFLTWTDLSGNAFPTSPSYTITGLDQGVHYKVRVRARYDGLSGAWSDIVEAVVASAASTATPTSTATPIPADTATPTSTLTQEDAKAIGAVHLESNQPGELKVSWDAPTDTPRDYRVSWARVNEDFLTWTDSSGNAFPTSPSYTITGLDQGVRYKVIVRARYDGPPGAWSDEVEAVVASAAPTATDTAIPTPAPPQNLQATAAHDAVTLTWDDPDDSSITGYQILRRNPAVQPQGEFTVLSENTGSGATRYVDNTVATQTRYFYWVKTRNASGLSEQSGIAEAAIPSAPEATPTAISTATPTAIPTAMTSEPPTLTETIIPVV